MKTLPGMLLAVVLVACGGQEAGSKDDASIEGSPADTQINESSAGDVPGESIGADGSVTDANGADRSSSDARSDESGGDAAAEGGICAADATGLPLPGTAACDMQIDDAGNGACVLCCDEKWHCDGPIFDQCPAGIQKGGSCSGWTTGASCFAPCPGGSGVEWNCQPNMTWAGPFPGSGCPDGG
jgi:hypothetical protein